MKRLSIKTRVTLWYVCFLIIVVAVVFAALAYTSNRLVQKDIQSDLAGVVEDSVRDVKVKNGTLDIDDDMVNYRDGVYVLVYGENNFLITGSTPEDLKKEIPFISDETRKVSDGKDEYYVYDHLISEKNFEDIWIRGITPASLTESDPVVSFMLKAFFILLPLLILLAALGGYTITKRAFKPVASITHTAHEIEVGEDLSKRIDINAKSSKDEIYELAATFDRMLNRLEASFQAEKQFSNDASHELRTPIAVIITQCEYALNKAASLPEAQAALEIILNQAQKMSGLIAQLLTLARADRGAAKLTFETINLSDLLDMVALEKEEDAAQKNISIIRDIEPELFSHVDQTLITRLFINLISNAIQYGNENGYIKIRLQKEETVLRAQIIDNGVGIAPENLPKIWDRFYQVDTARTSDQSGSMGLGLSMVKWIVEAHHGQITVESKLGEGSTFTIDLPL